MKIKFKIETSLADISSIQGRILVWDDEEPLVYFEDDPDATVGAKEDIVLVTNYFKPQAVSFPGILHPIYITRVPDEISEASEIEFDMVHMVKHYQMFKGIQAKDIMEVVAESHLMNNLTSWEIHCFLTSLKYRLRAGGKDDIEQDLEKAERYKQCLK